MSNAPRSTDTGFMVYAQNSGMVVRDYFTVVTPRYRRTGVTHLEAKRAAWSRVLGLVARLDREGHPHTYVEVSFFEPNATARSVFYAAPGTDNWERVRRAIAASLAADENRDEIAAASYECAA